METNGLPHHPYSGPRRLACRQCQRRKIKCTREFPCLQCTQAGITCEQSSRKKRATPRVKSKREDDLRNRVASLESLVHRLNGDEPTSQSPTDVSDIRPSTNKYLASPFWSSLAGEVQSLREALEDDEEDQSDQDPSDSDLTQSPATDISNPVAPGSTFEFVLCNPSNILVFPDALYKPDALMSLDLYSVHRDRVDRTLKIFHAPTLREFTENGLPYLGLSADQPCNRALKAAIQYAAISQLTDEECVERYRQQRPGLRDSFQRSVEMSLIQADPMNATTLPTLQALVLYTATLRRNDVSRRAWMIFALVVRLARALALHRESTNETFYTRELNRRLWHTIIVLDVFFALDRGSQPLILLGSFSRPLPSNVNDDDFGEKSLDSPARQGCVTDMTFALAMEDLCTCIHRINFFEEKPAGETWQRRLQLAQAQEKATEENYLCYCDPSVDFHRHILHISRVVLTTLTLRAVRPMQHDPTNPLPPIDSPWVFELALNSLRQCCKIMNDPPLAKWKQLPWVQWHPLAVVLAGLCSIKDMKQEQEHEAWQLVDDVMARSADKVADTKKGALWQPLVKLYKKALASKRMDTTNIPQNHHSSDVPATSAGNESSTPFNSLVLDQSSGLDNGMVDLSYQPTSLDLDNFAGVPGGNDELDWDLIIADMDMSSNENNILWL